MRKGILQKLFFCPYGVQYGFLQPIWNSAAHLDTNPAIDRFLERADAEDRFIPCFPVLRERNIKPKRQWHL